MPAQCTDILQRFNYLDISTCLAFTAALISWFDPHQHGSVANSSIVNAGHWVLVFMLIGARVKVAEYIKTDIECTWLLYGFMLGEVDLDCAACVTLMALSAFAFQRYRRAERMHPLDTPCAVDLETGRHTVDGDEVGEF